MYKLRYFEKYLCKHIDYDSRICNTFSIWGFDLTPFANFGQHMMKTFTPCTYEIFPVIYWTVMLVGICGAGSSIYEFLTVYHGNKCLSTFRSRKFYVLPGVFRRNSRLIGSAFMAKFYVLMLLGVIMMYPAFIIPYLTVQALSLGMELILWGMDLVLDDEFMSFSTIVSYAMFIITWIFVQCVKSVFEEAIESGNTQNLSLIKM